MPLYITIIRPVLIYGEEARILRSEEKLLERTETRMLRCYVGVTLKG